MEGIRSGKLDRTFLKIYITTQKSIPAGGIPTLHFFFPIAYPTSILLGKNGSVGFSLPPTSRLSHGDGSGGRAGRVICSSEKSERVSGFAVGRENFEQIWCDDVCELDECFAYA